jgi:hypothetical protein
MPAGYSYNMQRGSRWTVIPSRYNALVRSRPKRDIGDSSSYPLTPGSRCPPARLLVDRPPFAFLANSEPFKALAYPLLRRNLSPG